jgi:hypothetical protein
MRIKYKLEDNNNYVDLIEIESDIAPNVGDKVLIGQVVYMVFDKRFIVMELTKTTFLLIFVN